MFNLFYLFFKVIYNDTKYFKFLTLFKVNTVISISQKCLRLYYSTIKIFDIRNNDLFICFTSIKYSNCNKKCYESRSFESN